MQCDSLFGCSGDAQRRTVLRSAFGSPQEDIAARALTRSSSVNWGRLFTAPFSERLALGELAELGVHSSNFQ
jgi:hypothetical protein